MSTWSLEPGCERPIIKERPMAKQLTPDEIADRCEALGHRVDRKGTRYRVYHRDGKQGPVFYPAQFGEYRSFQNTLSDLRRIGIDVYEEPTVEKRITPADLPPKLRVNGARPTLQYTKDDPKPELTPTREELDETSSLVEMLAEAEKVILAQGGELRALSDRLDRLEGHAGDVFAALTTRVARLERAMPTPIDPNAELDEAILAFMRANPIKLHATTITQNLDLEIPGGANTVGKRLQSLATRGLVESSQPHGAGTNKIYWLPR